RLVAAGLTDEAASLGALDSITDETVEPIIQEESERVLREQAGEELKIGDPQEDLAVEYITGQGEGISEVTALEPIAPLLVTSEQIFEATRQERGRLFRAIDDHVTRLQLAEVITAEQAREFQAAANTVSDRLRTATKLSESGLDDFLSAVKAIDLPLPARVTPTEPVITHTGTEPEGISIGNELGIRFDGILDIVPGKFFFTDVEQTGTSFPIPENTLESARAELARIRAEFDRFVDTEVTQEGMDVEDLVPIDIPFEPVIEETKSVPMVSDVTLSRFRPAWRIFDQMGIFDQWKAIFSSETQLAEERSAFIKALNVHVKAVNAAATKGIINLRARRASIKARRALIWEFLNSKSQEAFNQMNFEEKRAANFIKKNLDSWADRLNIPETRRQENYIAHIFDDAAKDRVDLPIESSMSQMFSDKISDRVNMPFLKTRLGKESGLIKDPFLAAQTYNNYALRVFYYEPMLQNIKLMAEEKSTPDGARRFLTEYSKRMTGEPSAIDKEINSDLAKIARTMKGIPGAEKFAEIMEKGNALGAASYNLTSGLYFLWLGFKPTTAIRNLSQHGLIIAEVDGIQDFGNGVRLRFTKEGQDAIKESLVDRSRRGAFIEGIDSSLGAQWTDAFRETALFLFRKADEQNVKDAFLAGYSEAKRLYPDADRSSWIKRGDEVARRTQFVYTKMG
ncbi:hypothetical protein LCGC14_2096820, partial [marine sediment metagenome]